MSVFDHPEFDGHEKVVFHEDKESGLKAIIAIHNRNLGPALGGCRMWPYANSAEALTDVLRLSRGMSYKSALAELPLGGGKSVIIGDAHCDKSPAMMRAMGRLVESLNGAYITAEDVGIGVEDARIMAGESRFVTGYDKGDGEGGDPSPMTAYGVYRGMQSAWKHRHGSSDLAGVKVAVQGVGKVGMALVELLADAGALVSFCDTYAPSIERASKLPNVKAVSTDEIFSVEADIFAPCAMGASVNAQTIPQLRAGIVAGSANNQLARAEDAELLAERGILYVPDYVINAGGVVEVYYQYSGGDKSQVRGHIDHIADHTLSEIFKRAYETGLSTAVVADQIGRERIMGQGAENSCAA